MRIEHTVDWHDEPTLTIDPRQSPKHLSDTNRSAVPFDETHVALEAYQAYDEGYLAEIPWALEAYLDHDQLAESR